MKITQVRLNAAAKINLTLDITGRRSDGYHELESVMQTVSLYDTVDIKATGSGKIELNVNVPFIPTDARNTCYKAAMLYFEACGTGVRGVSIRVDKNIPSSAGLGGGSADAAAVLRGMEYLFGKCPVDIYSVAAKIGADVPFCLAGGTRLCEGIGEIMTPVSVKPHKMHNFHLVIAKNARGLSTPFMFSKFDECDASAVVRPDSSGVINALCEGNVKLVSQLMGNVFQPIAISERPEIAQLIDTIKLHGALNAIMTGSGAAVFGIFDNFHLANKCARTLKAGGIFAEYANFISPKR